MHQHPRPPPQMASPASSPSTNPTRTNNSREERRPVAHSRVNSEVSAYNEGDETPAAGDESAGIASGPSKDSVEETRPNHSGMSMHFENSFIILIFIRTFHTKAAIVILQSRVSLPVIIGRDGSRKVNKWVSRFNFSLLKIHLTPFSFNLKQMILKLIETTSASGKPVVELITAPPALIVETYLDTTHLTRSQSLVVLDDQGKRWDVQEVLNSSNGSNDGNPRPHKARTEVILERWKIELKEGPQDPHDFGAILPTVYKKNIVFFRALYSTTKFVPAWKFAKAWGKSGTSNGLRIKCRIINNDDFQVGKQDPLTHPLYDSDTPVTDRFSLGETDSPVGRFSGEIEYRRECNFRVDDSEALLSSRFMGADEHFFQPSLDSAGGSRHRSTRTRRSWISSCTSSTFSGRRTYASLWKYVNLSWRRTAPGI